MPVRSTLLAAAALLLLTAGAQGNDDELKRIEGRFDRTYSSPSGAVLRAVMEVSADNSTVTTYDSAGNVIESHRSTIKVEKRGSVNVLSFSKLEVTAGPNKGHIDPGTRSYIYRFDGETFAEAWGLLEGDASPARMFYWHKIKED